jgi:ankyrin repeat protein
MSSSSSILELLLNSLSKGSEEKKAKIYTPGKMIEKGYTELFLAVKCREKVERIRKLIADSPEDIDKASKKGLLPLFIAAKTMNYPAVKALLEAGADPRSTSGPIQLDDEPKETKVVNVIDYAFFAGNLTLLQLYHQFLSGKGSSLVTHARMNGICDQLSNTFILLSRGHIQCLIYLFKIGLSPSEPIEQKTGLNMLHFAVRFKASDLKRVHTLSFLLSCGADPNRQKKDGFTPLHIAAMNNKDDIVDLLLLMGADPTLKVACSSPEDKADEQGMTAYEIAKERKCTAVLEVMNAHAIDC